MNQRIKLPIKFIAVLFTVVIFIMIALGYQVLSSHQDLESIQSRTFRLQHHSEQLTYLNEVLTMSARMAAETSDLYWERRYFKHVELLDDILRETALLSGEIYQEWADQTALANAKRVQIETQVFSLISEGKAPEAQVLLNNEDYEIYKQNYAAAMRALQHDLETKIASDINKHERSVYIAGIQIIISIPFLILIWIRIVSLLKQYRQVTEDSQQKLLEEYDYSRMLFDTSPIGLALTDMQGKLVDSNPAYHNIIGYTQDEIEKLSYWDITPK
ncbi:MAG: PAS domain S-box protein, partial [Gammaproteobacteria bacterium]|nr:PAS domain S-box protein [Gammaproteobacteria bacterium]